MLVVVYEPLFRALGIGVAEGAPIAGAVLDAIDRALLGAETKGDRDGT